MISTEQQLKLHEVPKANSSESGSSSISSASTSSSSSKSEEAEKPIELLLPLNSFVPRNENEESEESEESDEEEKSDSENTISDEYLDPSDHPRAADLHKFDSHTLAGAILYIGEGSYFWRNNNGQLTEKFDSPQTIRLVDVSVCYVSEVNNSPVPNFKSPELVTNLTFDGTISQENFKKLVAPCSNLCSLGIHLSSFDTLDFRHRIMESSALPLDSFPNLENLVISSLNFDKQLARSYDMVLIIENIIEFLKFPFPKLNFLSVSCPMVAGLEQKYATALFGCMIRQNSSIKYLNMESLFKISSAFLGGFDEEDDDENDEHSLQTQDKDFPPIQYDVTEANEVNLNSFHLYLVHPTGSTELWRNFLLTQKHLEYCQFWCKNQPCPFYPFIAGIIRQNIKTLHTFACHVEQMDGKPIDFSIFKDSAKISTLVLKGVHTFGEPYYSTSDLINVGLLPDTVDFIKILHLSMTQSDLSFIARKLPNLRTLYLEDIGESDNFGLSFKDLSYLLQGRKSNKLENLHVYRSLNRDSFEEDFSADKNDESQNDGYRIMAKILLKSLNDIKFQAELNDEGVFDNICESISNNKGLNENCEADTGEVEDDDCQPLEEDSWDILYDNCNTFESQIDHSSQCDTGEDLQHTQCNQCDTGANFQHNYNQRDTATGFQHNECVQCEGTGDCNQPGQRQFMDEYLEPINCSQIEEAMETFPSHREYNNRTGQVEENDDYCSARRTMGPVRFDIPHCDHHRHRYPLSPPRCRIRYLSCDTSPTSSSCCSENHHSNNHYPDHRQHHGCNLNSRQQHQPMNIRRCQNQPLNQCQPPTSQNQPPRTGRINVPETIHEHEYEDNEEYDIDE